MSNSKHHQCSALDYDFSDAPTPTAEQQAAFTAAEEERISLYDERRARYKASHFGMFAAEIATDASDWEESNSKSLDELLEIEKKIQAFKRENWRDTVTPCLTAEYYTDMGKRFIRVAISYSCPRAVGFSYISFQLFVPCGGVEHKRLLPRFSELSAVPFQMRNTIPATEAWLNGRVF